MEETVNNRAHVLVVPFPGAGHVNPMLQFSRRLVSKGLKITFVITKFISKSMQLGPSIGSVQLDSISDGFDEGGRKQAGSLEAYLVSLHDVGPKSLLDLIQRHQTSSSPIDFVIYEPFLSWALDVAVELGLPAAAFFTHTCAVNYIWYSVYHKLLPVPVSSTPVSIPGLPMLQLQDLPSFVVKPGSYPANLKMTTSQFANLDKADHVLVNSFYELEPEAADTMSKICPLFTIGPTVPSMYLDNRIENEDEYGLDLFPADTSISINWLRSRPAKSVVYVSFGSVSNIVTEKQTEEIAWALTAVDFCFLWVVKDVEENNLPKGFKEEAANKGKGLVVKWSPQMKVLASKAVGCFFTHSGWNSTIEGLSLGVPMVTLPQWSDQPTNSKYVEDVWKVGIRAKADDENGIVKREQIALCINEVMKGERGREMEENCKKWRTLAIEAVSEGGTSDRNINEFVGKVISYKS